MPLSVDQLDIAPREENSADKLVVAWDQSDVPDACGSVCSTRRVMTELTSVPAGVLMPQAASVRVIDIAAGREHNLVLLSDGTVLGWGRNDAGQATPPANLGEIGAPGPPLSERQAVNYGCARTRYAGGSTSCSTRPVSTRRIGSPSDRLFQAAMESLNGPSPPLSLSCFCAC